MKSFFLPIFLLILLSCGKEFEPKLTGWQATTHPSKRVLLNIDGQEKTIRLPGGDSVGYRFAQWTKWQPHMLLTQVVKTGACDDYQIISIDTAGIILDTIYTAPPNTPVNFKLAPNDSILLVKTYYDDCEYEAENFNYTFFNRFSKTGLADTISVKNARGILLPETVWSPDSKKVIITDWYGRKIKAFTYNLATRDTAFLAIGSNFTWSPTDNNLVAYIKDYSIYARNMETEEEELIYEGTRKKFASHFRWNPNGDFLMIHISSYLLNVEANPLQRHTTIYLSMTDKSESRVYYDDQRIATWKDAKTTNRERRP